jgi:hypothetical protein
MLLDELAGDGRVTKSGMARPVRSLSKAEVEPPLVQVHIRSYLEHL